MRKLLLVACLLSMITTGSATNWYVSTTGDDNSLNGKNKSTPLKTVAKALSSSNVNDTINVAGGTYSEPWGLIDKSLTFLGSWNNDFSARTQPSAKPAYEWDTPSIISVDGPVASVTATTVIGTIEGFSFSKTGKLGSGNTIITILSTKRYNYKKCKIANNDFNTTGNCLVLDINAGTATSTVTVENCLIASNYFLWAGTSHTIRVAGTSKVDFLNCIITDNLNANNLINMNVTSECRMINCKIYNNKSVRAQVLNGSSTTLVLNCLIFNNGLTNPGTPLVAGAATVVNTTIANNTYASVGSTGISLTATSKFYNSIIHNNTLSTTAIGFTGDVSGAQIKNCAFDGANLGGNVTARDNITLTSNSVNFIRPSSFVGATTDAAKIAELEATDWTLQEASPLVDAGQLALFKSTSYGGANELDITGHNRKLFAETDMGAYECRSGKIDPAKPVEVQNNETYTVENITLATNTTTASQIINNGGTVSVTGKVRTIVSFDKVESWMAVSFPYTVNKIYLADGTTEAIRDQDYYLCEYDAIKRATGIAGWKFSQDNGLIVNKAYMLASKTVGNLVFEGEGSSFNTNAFTTTGGISLSYTTSPRVNDAGWNFVVQPNMANSALTVDEQIVYTYSNDGFVSSNQWTEGSVNTIPFQSYFVKTPSGKSTIGFGPRIGARTTAAQTWDIVSLSISDNQKSSATRIILHPDATSAYNETFDAPKMFFMNPSIPQVWTQAEAVACDINGIEENGGSVPVSVQIPALGNYAFALSGDTYNLTTASLYDKQTGSRTSLLNGAEYNFDAVAGTIDNRFEISISKVITSVAKQPTKGWSLYTKDQNLCIDRIESGSMIRISDITGKTIVAETSVDGSYRIALNQGLYLVSVNGETTKVSISK